MDAPPSPAHFRHWPRGLPRTLTVPAVPLTHLLEVSAARYPDKPWVVFYGAALGYAEAAERVARLAGALATRFGIRPGDRVLLVLQNSPQFAIALFAVLTAGAVAVPVSPACRRDELAHYLDDSGARVAIAGQELLAEIAPLAEAGALEAVIIAAYSEALPPDCDFALHADVAAPRAAIDGRGLHAWQAVIDDATVAAVPAVAHDALALMPYTSGSTGRPKGCMHTHATVMANVAGAALWESIHPMTVALGTAPMFHVTGLVHTLLATTLAGGTIVPQPRWHPATAARLVEAFRCTHWANAPAMVVDILSDAQALAYDVSSLENVFGGGAPMPEAVAKKLFDTCGIHYMEGYGLTETISQTHTNPAQNPKRQCLGIPVFGTESIIADPDTRAVLAPGEQGEILVRGPQLFRGYWGNGRATAEAWIELDGRRWFRTGDLGRMDGDGYFTISDRLKRMINAAGFKVWPAEVEAAMYAHPAILECLVIASPDERRGETVKLVAVLKPEAVGVDGAALETWARTRMAAYKVPRRFEFVQQLPRTPSGKLQWKTLQDREFAAVRGRETP